MSDVSRTSGAEAALRRALAHAGITVDGDAPHDSHVHDRRFYRRVLRDGSLGLGESYVEGWWDAKSVDGFIERILSGGLARRVSRDARSLAVALAARLLNLQRRARAARNVRSHYERDLDLFRVMLGPGMVYSCGYWMDGGSLEAAQEAKLELCCRKVGLSEGKRLLDIGCGWGSLAEYAARKRGAEVVGITLSPEQAEVARERCRGLPVEIRVQDYREIRERFDAVVSVGMFEHVGRRNHQAYMEAVGRCLAPGGLSLLHTIAGNEATSHIDPWIHRYIFPGAQLPTLAEIASASEGCFLVEDVHNFGPHYDRTLMAWHHNVEAGWDALNASYDERFRRAWRYYLLSCAASFRARFTQLFQLVLARPGTRRGDPPAWDNRAGRLTGRSLG